jgi:hypothetical protein
MKITCTTDKGGAVELNKAHGVWASYAVAKVGNLPAREIFYAGVTLNDGRKVGLFVNRETGLVVVDEIYAKRTKGADGYEHLRIKLDGKRPPKSIVLIDTGGK